MSTPPDPLGEMEDAAIPPAVLHFPRQIQLIPIAQIDVLNTRERNQKVFSEIVASIKAIGIKKPITVTPRSSTAGERFLLVCGEGRLNAFKELGEHQIPAQIVEVSDEDAFVMGLVENIARRQQRPLEFLLGISALRERGNDPKEIALKTGLSADYVYGILALFDKGEKQILVAVQTGKIPLNVALSIVGKGNADGPLQQVLQDAYESGELRGRRLIAARRLMTDRHRMAKLVPGEVIQRPKITAAKLVSTYRKEVERQRTMIRRAEHCHQQLLFVTAALRQLFSDQDFVTLLRKEGLDTLPQKIANRISESGLQP